MVTDGSIHPNDEITSAPKYSTDYECPKCKCTESVFLSLKGVSQLRQCRNGHKFIGIPTAKPIAASEQIAQNR